MARNGWEHDELHKEIHKSNLADLIVLYKRETDKLQALSVEFVTHMDKWTEEGKTQHLTKCDFQDEAKVNVALAIADMLTKTSVK